MSQINLSPDLVNGLGELLISHDQRASDPGIMAQYLCAISGLLLGQMQMPQEHKHQLADELAGFIRQVSDDVSRQQEQAPPTPSPQDAFGIWKPGG